MYQIDDRQSLSFWMILLILPLFFILGWSSRGILQSDLRNMDLQFIREPVFEPTNQAEIVIPIPASDVVKPEKPSTVNDPDLENSPLDQT